MQLKKSVFSFRRVLRLLFLRNPVSPIQSKKPGFFFCRVLVFLFGCIIYIILLTFIMPYRVNPSYENEYYHVYNRGNNYGDIFFEEKNYHFFLSRMTGYFLDRIDIVAFCLMPNHYHLLLKVNETGSLEKAMHRLAASYSKAINTKYGRVGHLFQSRYKSKLVPGNDYLLHLSRYIHLNPVRAKLVCKPEEWKHSSYRHYIGLEKVIFVKPEIILDQIGEFEKYKNFTLDYDEDQNYYVKDMRFN